MRIADLLNQICLTKSSSVAIVQPKRSLMYTYGQLQNHVFKLSRFMEDNGCVAGMKVGLFLNNSSEYIIAFFAISEANATIVPLARELTPYELKHKVKTTDISVIISDKKGCAEIKEIGIDVNLISITLTDKLEINHDVYNKTMSWTDNFSDGTALMISTSGCIGQPKHVMLTDHQLISNVQAYQKVMSFRHQQKVYCSLPFCHIYSISAQILTHISIGDTLLIPESPFFIKDFFETVSKEQITISAFVPYYAILMSQLPEVQKYNLKTLKYILLAGGKTPVELLHNLKDKYPSVSFINSYGLTEAGPRVSIAGPDSSEFPVGSVGAPMPGVAVKILDDFDNPLEPGEIGQIVIKSSGVMQGYYRQPMLTKEVLSEDGWLKTGDIGQIDNEGLLYIKGRQKNIIISGGRNIYPYEVEECLLKHPLIVEAAVVSKSQYQLQEVPYAYIVTKENTTINYYDFIVHCRKYLSSYKIPHGFKILKALPKIGASKVNRRQLAELLD